MVITLTGNNSHLLKLHRDKLVDAFIAEQGELALERIDGSAAEFDFILDAVQSMPFLASKKMVVVRELAANKEAAEKIEQIISSVSSTTDLVIYEPVTDKRTAYYKALKSKTQFEEFNDLEPRALAIWLVEEARKMDSKLSQTDAAYLIDRLGTNQAILFSELEKLSLYDREIARQNIDLLTERNPQSTIFDLLDATFSGNRKMALDLYGQQRAQKVEAQAILALLAWQLHIIAIAKYGRGKTTAQIAKEAKINPYPLGKAQNLATRITDEKLKQMIAEAAEIDYRSKTFALDVDEALRTYIATV
ncbi:MAG: polymerase subunit delta [Candidatus Saccharibacteria bacterium]|nr:polymerase subunit delta [Candidatus Saccharibacteria bacterium]